MVSKNKYWILTIALFIVLQVQAQSPKAFYVGHSLSDQIPDMVQSLSIDHKDLDFTWVYQSIPGAPLRWQWDRLNVRDYSPIEPYYYGFYDQDYGLPAGDFDVLVLTESVPRYEAIINETYQYADSFYRYATQRNPNIRVYLYEDWHCILSGTPTGCDYDIDSNPWRQRLTDDLPMWEGVVDTLNARFAPENPVCLIPAGQGLAALYDSIQIGAITGIFSIDDIFSDNIHLNDVGKYYVACIHFSMIHGVSPVGLTNQLKVWWGGDFTAPSAALALKFQEMAWETVQRYPRSCVNSISSAREKMKDRSVSIYPNPSSGLVTIALPTDLLRGNIQIVSLTGEPVFTAPITNSTLNLDVSSWPSGFYVVSHRAISGKILSVQKLLIK